MYLGKVAGVLIKLIRDIEMRVGAAVPHWGRDGALAAPPETTDSSRGRQELDNIMKVNRTLENGAEQKKLGSTPFSKIHFVSGVVLQKQKTRDFKCLLELPLVFLVACRCSGFLKPYVCISFRTFDTALTRCDEWRVLQHHRQQGGEGEEGYMMIVRDDLSRYTRMYSLRSRDEISSISPNI